MTSRRWISEVDRATVLRRLAIVLRDLAPGTYKKIIASLDDSTKRDIADAITNLGQVSAEERQHSFELFQASFEIQREQKLSTDSLHLSGLESNVEHSLSESPPAVTDKSKDFYFRHQAQRFRAVTSPEAVSAFSFLNEMDSQSLHDLLIDEHSQTIALVLASIEPALAASVLAKLDAKMQQQTMERISQLSNIPHAAFEELSAHFRMRIKTNSNDKTRRVGHDALKAIMNVMPADTCNDIEQSQTDATGYSESTITDKTRRTNSIDANAIGDKSCSPSLAGTEINENNSGVRRDAEVVENWSTEEVHQHLIHLSPKTLCQALSHVPTRDALLTLCGVPAGVANRVLALLSRSQAKSVRKKMNSIQSMSLKEIDAAKRKVSGYSREIARYSSLTSNSA